MTTDSMKRRVQAHWAAQPCGTRDMDAADRSRFFADLERERYEREPYIREFARFDRAKGKTLLEIGVGAGTDFVNWVRNGAIATGVDLTEQGVALTRERLALEGLSADVHTADAEQLPFADASFDIVYSFGVLHHSPDTARALDEVYRVLKPNGCALIMIYHLHSWVSLMMWSVHCAAKLKPWKSPRWAVYHHLESPGTKAYTLGEARELFSKFSAVDAYTQLSHGDLLLMRPADIYRSWPAELAWKLYPRWAIRQLGNRFGTCLLIEATK